MTEFTKIKITATMPYFPTEDDVKLKTAFTNIFPDMELEYNTNKNLIIGISKSILNFSELLKRQRIRDTARTILLRGIRNYKTYFKLNKQAAFVGKINFVGEREPQVLGEISVFIESENIKELIKEITVTNLDDISIPDTNNFNEETE
jgi:predicted RNA binding protein with dsRBD fold (UPF0201 family)